MKVTPVQFVVVVIAIVVEIKTVIPIAKKATPSTYKSSH